MIYIIRYNSKTFLAQHKNDKANSETCFIDYAIIDLNIMWRIFMCDDQFDTQGFLINEDELAPIVLFIFNRPDCVERTLAALGNNLLANKTDLFIYADGPRGKKDEMDCRKSRDVVKKFENCFKNVEMICRTENWGLARNSVSGITEVINSRGKMIMMEDDTVPSPFFLKYMNIGLQKYQKFDDVMEITGFQMPIKCDDDPRAVFIKGSYTWAWGTWSDRWKKYHRNAEELMKSFSSRDIYNLNFDGSVDIYDQLRANRDGQMNTWAVFWAAVRYLNGGYMLCPTKSLIQMIGFDERSEHNTKENVMAKVELYNGEILHFPDSISEDLDIRKKIVKTFEGELSFKAKMMLKMEKYISRR